LNVVAVVVAAGSGSRLPGAVEKQFLPIGGRPIVVHALAALTAAPEVGAIVLAVPRGREEFARREIAGARGVSRVAAVVAGGATRAESVRLALAAIPAATDWVLVHDAVRPFATPALVARVLAAACETGAAIPALPLVDTVKRVSAARASNAGAPGESAGSRAVVETIDRTGLWAAQTPQAFGQRLLLEALRSAGDDAAAATDCAALVERVGGTVRVVEGEPWNIKITGPDDLVLAEAIAVARGTRA
jgi:2-C-methyl-D-erythritol 4-phosphate cytidylyltransferase